MTFISTLFFIQHSNSLHRTMSLYCMKRDDRDEKRIEETLKYKVVVAQRKLTYYWLSDRFGINIFAKRLSCGFKIHFFTFAIDVWKFRLLYSVSSTHLVLIKVSTNHTIYLSVMCAFMLCDLVLTVIVTRLAEACFSLIF